MDTTVQSIWTKTRLLVKALIIGLLVLILQIPTIYVKDLIIERETRQKEAIAEVSSKWAGRQNVAGPVLVLPYWLNTGDSLSNTPAIKRYAYFLPDDLKIKSHISPEEKYRGIYKVMLYSSKMNLKGSYNSLPLNKLNIDPSAVIWNEAFVQIQIADIKGLNDDAKLNWNGNQLTVNNESVADYPVGESIIAPLKLNGIEDTKKMDFNIDLDISGSEQLLFTPVGKTTTVDVEAKWPHPSFTGNILPVVSNIKKDSFSAKWKSVSQKRTFPQQWKNNAYSFDIIRGTVSSENSTAPSVSSTNITSASFGTNLFVPVNGYQKTLRSVKYAALCMLLTFAAFFIIETINKKSVHPFQYGLVGLALVLFYTLLLSFSEYAGFNFSYVIASVFTIGLIAWFVKGLLGSSRLAIVLSVVLLIMYTYVFTILQLQDYSLILGSLGLFITLAVIMHFSRKIQW